MGAEDLPVADARPVSHPQSVGLDGCIPAGGFRRSDVAAAVAEFHAAFNVPRQTQPSIDVEPALENLRISLLEEEVGELVAAINARDLTGIADALADITYVVYGTALTYGIDLDSVLGEVHRSNMSKLDHDGKPITRADGKVLKSELYSPPDVAAVLRRQVALGKAHPS
ncbi:MAG: MazG nucleotide pyrophosphohydrolase domain-containing protein [Pseudonocardiaceae bacterium]